jgi:hypothetical protein
MKIKINDVLDEFLYRYADEGGNFDDPFLKIVHDLLNVDAVNTSKQYVDKTQKNRHDEISSLIALTGQYKSMLANSVKELTDEEITQIVSEKLETWNTKESMIEFARAILKKAQEK